MSSYYENYRRGLIERHLCRNGRFNQAILLCQKRKDAEVLLPHRRTTEELPGGTPIAYEAYPVVLNGKVIGGGDNPLLSGGMLMMVFAIEDMLGVSKRSLYYARILLNYFEASQKALGQLYRRCNWWSEPVHVSKDEMVGALLGLDFYLQALKSHPEMKGDRDRALRLMRNIGVYLRDTRYAPAYTWVFQFPFTRLFKFNLGTSLLSGVTIPNNPNVKDPVLNKLLAILKSASLLNYWYKPKHLYRDTTRYLPLAYQGASTIDYPRKFFNVALYCHTAQMIFNKPVKSKVRKEMWKAFKVMFDYFARPGSRAGQGEGAQNAYLGVVAHAFARSVGSGAVNDLAPKMYRTTLNPEGVWAPNLPIFCLPGAMKFHHYYEGSSERLWGERFTWEHRDPKGHYLQWHWGKVTGSIGPPSRLELEDVDYADQSKGFVAETAGLGLLVVQALAAYYKLAPAPKLENDHVYQTFPLDGASP
jgi:hypothetical protein